MTELSWMPLSNSKRLPKRRKEQTTWTCIRQATQRPRTARGFIMCLQIFPCPGRLGLTRSQAIAMARYRPIVRTFRSTLPWIKKKM